LSSFEPASAQADALVDVQDRAPGVELDGQRDQTEQRGEQEQPRRGHSKAQGAAGGQIQARLAEVAPRDDAARRSDSMAASPVSRS